MKKLLALLIVGLCLTGIGHTAITGGGSSSSVIAGTAISGNISGKAANITGTVLVANGGTGVTTLTGLIRGNGTSPVLQATAGVDYISPTGTETLTNKTIDGSQIIGNITGNSGGGGTATSRVSRSFILNNPTATSFSFWRSPNTIMVKNISGVVVGGTNIVGILTECDANGLNPVAVHSPSMTLEVTNVNLTPTTNATIDAGDYVGWTTTSVSGAVSKAIITFDYE